MSENIGYESLKGIERQEVLARVSFPTKRENAIGESSMKSVNRDAIYGWNKVNLNYDLLGLIPRVKQTVPYKDVVNRVMDSLDKAGLEYKVISTTVEGTQQDMFQKYVFSSSIDNPDGESLSPLMTLRSSYVGSPFSIEFGTYRFICSNGAMVSHDIVEKYHLNANYSDIFHKVDVGDVIKKRLEQISAVSERYKELADEEWIPYFASFIQSSFIQKGMKTKLFENYAKANLLSFENNKISFKNGDLIKLKLAGHTIYDSEGEPIISFNMSKFRDKSAWDFYNDLTAIATHETKSESARQTAYRTISELFVA